MPKDYIREHLRKHFTWEQGTKKDPFLSHWISFISLINFTLTHAYRKSEGNETNIMIAIIDTYKLKESV